MKSYVETLIDLLLGGCCATFHLKEAILSEVTSKGGFTRHSGEGFFTLVMNRTKVE